jgi:hypothetical protein
MAGGCTYTIDVGACRDGAALFFDTLLQPHKEQMQLHVGFPAAGVGKIAALMFPTATSAPRDVTSADVIEIAAACEHHPDSARKIALGLYTRWQEGHPYTLVHSAAVADPSASRASLVSSTQVIDHRKRERFSEAVHAEELSCMRAFLVADIHNYIYRADPDVMNKLVVYSTASKYSKAALLKFTEALHRPRALNLPWQQAFVRAVADRMNAKAVAALCLTAAVYVSKCSASPLFTLSFQREKKIVKLVIDPSARFLQLDVQALSDVYQQHARAVDANSHRTKCIQCQLGAVSVRCDHCGELRYCRRLCLEADWAAKHSGECRVYLKKISKQPQPPGGAAVLQQKVPAAAAYTHAAAAAAPPGGCA